MAKEIGIRRAPSEARLDSASQYDNRTLSEEELHGVFRPLFAEVIGRLEQSAGDDPALLWALRRKLKKELEYLERGKPAERRKLKARKMQTQRGKCAECDKTLPEKGAVLDRTKAMDGYTEQNIRLLCPECDIKKQAARRYR